MKKKIITLFLSAVMLLSIFPLLAFADGLVDGSEGDYICGDYEYNIVSEDEKTCRIMEYVGLNEDVIIPQTLDGYSVVEIDSMAFRGLEIKSVVIPEGITTIVGFGFCDNLTDVTIPNSVTSIDAFKAGYIKNDDGEYVPIYSVERVYGYLGSYAETYATEKGFDFIALNVANNTDNDITVVFDNENVYDKNLVVNVEVLDVQDNSIVYNITLTVDGIEVQPENSVTVKIPVPETMKATDVKVFREETDGTYTDMNAVIEDGYVVFSTEHFSKYILTTEDLNKPVEPEEDEKEPEQEEDKDTTDNTDKNENNDNLVTDVEIPNTDYNTSVAAAFVAMSLSGVALVGLKKKK